MIKTQELQINIGPQHPSTHGVFRMVATIDGETVVHLEPVLYRSDSTVFSKDDLGKVRVAARVVGHERGPKLTVFKFKPKRGYKRKTGHRQDLTRIEITEIANGS